MKLTDAAARVIDLEGRRTADLEAELRKRYPTYPLIEDPDFEEPPPPPVEAELKAFLKGLSYDMLLRLLLVNKYVWNRFAAGGIPQRYAELAEEYPRKSAVLDTIVVRYGIGENLVEGLERLRENGFDPDDLPVKPVKPAKPVKARRR